MGYTTFFTGSFKSDKPLTQEQIAYLKKFNSSRRVKRNPELLKNKPDPEREKVHLPVGIEGEFFVNGEGFMGQDRDPSVIDGNEPPITQPGLWCQWEISDDGLELKWDEGEKFYCHQKWLIYLVKNFFLPWGYILNGKVDYQGEDPFDRGTIIIKNNNIYLQLYKIDGDTFETIGKRKLKQLFKIETNKLD